MGSFCIFKIIGLIAVAAGASITPVAALAHDPAELHTFHCLHGCPAGSPGTDDIVVREIYTLASNDITKVADWVAYRVTPDTIGTSGERRWDADPWLSAEETLEPADYDQASDALQIDRGHQAPLAAFSGTPFAADTNKLSNITPQGSALNQAPWQRLEARELDLARRENIAVYVLTGPLFERMLPVLPKSDERHRVPSGYWKVIATSNGRMSAFIMDTQTPRGFDFCTAQVSLDEVELRAKLHLFPRLQNRRFTDLRQALGCTL